MYWPTNFFSEVSLAFLPAFSSSLCECWVSVQVALNFSVPHVDSNDHWIDHTARYCRSCFACRLPFVLSLNDLKRLVATDRVAFLEAANRKEIIVSKKMYGKVIQIKFAWCTLIFSSNTEIRKSILVSHWGKYLFLSNCSTISTIATKEI